MQKNKLSAHQIAMSEFCIAIDPGISNEHGANNNSSSSWSNINYFSSTSSGSNDLSNPWVGSKRSRVSASGCWKVWMLPKMIVEILVACRICFIVLIVLQSWFDYYLCMCRWLLFVHETVQRSHDRVQINDDMNSAVRSNRLIEWQVLLSVLRHTLNSIFFIFFILLIYWGWVQPFRYFK